MNGFYNKADSGKNTDSTVNGKPYLEVSEAYYNSSMYEGVGTDRNNVIDDLFADVQPVFNAVPKVVNIASALAVGGEIVSTQEDGGFIDTIIHKTRLNKEKTFMARDLILGKSILVEVQNVSEDEEFDSAFVDPEFPYAISYYGPKDYEIMKSGNEILYAKIKGVRLEINDAGDKYVEKKIERHYIRDENGEARSWTVSGGEIDNEITYEGGVLPLVEITTTYDMKQLFYSIDRHNELEAFIRNILYLAGEPVLVGTGLDRLNKTNSEKMKDDKYKKQKALFTKNTDADLKLIEITGSSASVMISKQKALIESIVKDYPEYSISEVLSGSNVSEETTRIRLTEILSRVNEVRTNMELGLNQIIAIISLMEGKEMVRSYISLGSLTDQSMLVTLDVIARARELNFISRKSSMLMIKKLYPGEDVEVEMNAIDGEADETEEIINKEEIVNE